MHSWCKLSACGGVSSRHKPDLRARHSAEGSHVIVMKFGGTSVESADAIRRAAGIVQARLAEKPVVVVFPMGKTTNKLLAIAAEAVRGERDIALELLDNVRQFHLSEGAALVSKPRLRKDVEATVTALFDELE